MSPPPGKQPLAARWLLWLATSSLAAAGILWLAVLVLRAGYPYHLEWLESNVFCHALRFARGWPLYEDPSLGLPSHPYGPLYYIACAGLLQLFDPALWVCRAISQASALWIALCAAILAQRWSGRRSALIIAPLAWFALLPTTAFWYDLARVDTLAVALLLQGFVLLEGLRRPGLRLGAAVLILSLAALTKQSCLPLAMAGWVCAPPSCRPLLRFAGCLLTAALTAALYLLLDAATGGLLLYYTLELPLGHPWEWRHMLALFVLPALALVLCGLAAALAPRRTAPPGARGRILALWALTALICAWTATKQGAYLNHFMPLAALTAALAASVVAILQSSFLGLRSQISAALLGTAALVCIASSDPREQVPTRADRAAGDAWVRWLRSVPIDVQVPAFTYLPVLAGKEIHVHEMGAWEVFLDWQRRLAAEIGEGAALEKMAAHPDLRAFTHARPTAFILSLQRRGSPGISFFAPFLRNLPERERWPYEGPDVFRCPIGLDVRPEVLYLVPPGTQPAPPPFPR